MLTSILTRLLFLVPLTEWQPAFLCSGLFLILSFISTQGLVLLGLGGGGHGVQQAYLRILYSKDCGVLLCVESPELPAMVCDGVQVCLEVGEEGAGLKTYLGVLFVREEAVDTV